MLRSSANEQGAVFPCTRPPRCGITLRVKTRLSVGEPGRILPHALADEAGAFAWWYVDAVDAADPSRAVVCIFSFALPFLPGMLAAARRGERHAANARPAVSVAWMENGVCTDYLLQEFGRDEAQWQSDATSTHVRMGASVLRIAHDGPNVDVNIELAHTSKACGSWHGRIHLRGRVPTQHMVEHTTATPTTPVLATKHQWDWQAAHATVEADLQVDGQQRRLQGHGYHDQNSGVAPLSEHGIARWLWGRVHSAVGDGVVYAVWHDDKGTPDQRAPDECTLLMSTAQGLHAQPCDLTYDLRANWLGMPHVQSLRASTHNFTMAMTATSCIDSGPFYTRSLWRGTLDNEAAVGVCEVVDPDRIDVAWQRPFVRMRVSTPKASWFLPLFAGTRAGRWRRFVRHILPKGLA
jgi:carotenoid 1,2-hydratase